jgi:hypothetical protein
MFVGTRLSMSSQDVGPHSAIATPTERMHSCAAAQGNSATLHIRYSQ